MVSDKPRILIYGNFALQNFEYCWLEWLRDHNYPVQAFNLGATLQKFSSARLGRRISQRFLQGVVVSYVSHQFITTAHAFQPDLILVVGGNLISAAAVQIIRQQIRTTLFHFHGEDFFNPLNTTKTLRAAALFYDHLFTTKSFNLPELAEIGLTQVSLIPHGYRPNCHYPVPVKPAAHHRYGSDLAFVGTWERERASTLAQLQEFDLRIWGNVWPKASKDLGLRQAIQNQAVYCQEMSRVFNASKICLAFLRKANRDQHTSRTFEIPACGGFQLSERTDEVLSFFEEGKEIECFASISELKDKAHYYLKHETQRQRIARAGLSRVRRSPYSYQDRLQTILEHYHQKYEL
jgi:hypothetical protein